MSGISWWISVHQDLREEFAEVDPDHRLGMALHGEHLPQAAMGEGQADHDQGSQLLEGLPRQILVHCELSFHHFTAIQYSLVLVLGS